MFVVSLVFYNEVSAPMSFVQTSRSQDRSAGLMPHVSITSRFNSSGKFVITFTKVEGSSFIKIKIVTTMLIAVV